MRTVLLISAGLVLLFAHSEVSKDEVSEDQDLSVKLHRCFLSEGLNRARRHRGIVARFGRFPHRNKILGRASVPAERRDLNGGGFRG